MFFVSTNQKIDMDSSNYRFIVKWTSQLTLLKIKQIWFKERYGETKYLLSLKHEMNQLLENNYWSKCEYPITSESFEQIKEKEENRFKEQKIYR
jgi:hypothetical protein